jgi:hypothetical protein
LDLSRNLNWSPGRGRRLGRPWPENGPKRHRRRRRNQKPPKEDRVLEVLMTSAQFLRVPETCNTSAYISMSLRWRWHNYVGRERR